MTDSRTRTRSIRPQRRRMPRPVPCTGATPRSRRRVAGPVGAVLALAALAVVWAARLSIPDAVYVSQLGTPSLPTADAFNAALLLLAVGAGFVAVAVRGTRATSRVLGAWSASVTLAAAGAAFAVASRVTCTDGCPVPLTPGATFQDLVHVTAAVLGFAGAAWAMLQVGWSDASRAVRLGSRVAAAGVAATAAAGGALSLLAFHTDVGAALELAATTVGILWLAALGLPGHRRTARRAPRTSVRSVP